MIVWSDFFLMIFRSSALLLLCLVVLQFGIVWIRLKYFWKDHKRKLNSSLPLVTVLVAARNEESSLPLLLQSLQDLDYPKEKLQLLFVDDQSNDTTGSLLFEFCAMDEQRECIQIRADQSQYYSKNGKANALAFLMEKARGDFYFFTDADCEVNPLWIKEGLSCFSKKEIGIVLGITQVKPKGLFQQFQALDWWNTLGYVKIASDLGIPTTGLGNNMVIRKEAYWDSGGFKNMPFSLTEDLEISKLIQDKGYELVHEVSSGMLVQTKGEPSFSKLLDQRKRWMSGVMILPWYWLVLLAIQFAYFFSLLFFIFTMPLFGLAVGVGKVLLQATFLRRVAAEAGQILRWGNLLLFDFYYFYTTLLTILYYFWPSKINWKSRNYP